MDQTSPHLAYQLPRDLFYQVIHSLRAALPLPVPDHPEGLVHRDNAAISMVASLLPANGDEAELAAQYVAAGAQALECLRLAGQYPVNIAMNLKCRAQALSMMREARAARSLLIRVQAERRKREADATALDQAERNEHAVMGLMADALSNAGSAPEAPPKPPQQDCESHIERQNLPDSETRRIWDEIAEPVGAPGFPTPPGRA